MPRQHPLKKKAPRHHAGGQWEGKRLANDFSDITRMALDDKYGRWKDSGKVGAPLSKRRNGRYVSPEDYPAGLFGGYDTYFDSIDDAMARSSVQGIGQAYSSTPYGPPPWPSTVEGELLLLGFLFVTLKIATHNRGD